MKAEKGEGTFINSCADCQMWEKSWASNKKKLESKSIYKTRIWASSTKEYPWQRLFVENTKGRWEGWGQWQWQEHRNAELRHANKRPRRREKCCKQREGEVVMLGLVVMPFLTCQKHVGGQGWCSSKSPIQDEDGRRKCRRNWSQLHFRGLPRGPNIQSFYSPKEQKVGLFRPEESSS